MKKRKSKRQIIFNRCMNLMSKVVRLKHANKDGIVKCFTCSTYKHYKEMDCGHYKHSRLDFDFRNRRPQCDSCNRHKSGRLDIFGEKLRDELGENEWAKFMLDAGTKTRKDLTIFELELIEQDLKNKLMEKENGIK